MPKRPIPLYDFTAFGAAIKAARNKRGESRKKSMRRVIYFSAVDCIMKLYCSKHINPTHSADLIEKLCGLSNKFFRSHVKNVHSVKEWNKTENKALFYNIEIVDTAIEEGKQLQYDYNKYGVDKKLHKSSFQRVTPYLLILHNKHYYLMAHSSYWNDMVFHRLDKISNISFYDKPIMPLREKIKANLTEAIKKY